MAHNIEQVTIAGTPADTNATVSYGGTDVDDTVDGFQKNLRAGNNRVTITVTAEDTTTTESWTVHVNRGVATLRGWKASDDFDTLKAAGHRPNMIWSNGTTMWVTETSEDKIYAYDMATKARDTDKDFDTLKEAGNENIAGIWSDGATMWVVDIDDEKIYAYDLATKARDADKDFNDLHADNEAPYGIWSDGTTMWVADPFEAKFFAYDMDTKDADADKDIDDAIMDAGFDFPIGIWSDGTTMWVTRLRVGTVFAFNFSTQARDSAKDFSTHHAAGSSTPTGMWSDGITMWVVDVDDEKIYSYVHRVLSTDTSLSAVSVDGTDLATFESDTTSHRHFVDSDVTEITVAGTATDDSASVEITSPADADDTEDGHQVSIWRGRHHRDVHRHGRGRQHRGLHPQHHQAVHRLLRLEAVRGLRDRDRRRQRVPPRHLVRRDHHVGGGEELRRKHIRLQHGDQGEGRRQGLQNAGGGP